MDIFAFIVCNMLIIKDNKNIHMDICIGQPDFREISDKNMHFSTV